ncbi:MAG: hypothetical protein HKN21_02150, partial [Candidatus Eisenbacteria bacterium]|nr:hypothetical protein [Candidatus Eisenbacteria bacterium]
MKNSLWSLPRGLVLGLALVGAFSISAQGNEAWGIDLRGQASLEGRWFSQDPLSPDQHSENLSFSIAPEFYQDWMGGDFSLTLSPFLRLDAGDDERTHADLREAFFLYYGYAFEIRAGLRQVFWGVAESQHLVDIINQTDQVENPDGEDKLGQPMVELTIPSSYGTLELSLLPGFRERTFAGVEGRFGGVEVEDGTYESDAEEWRLDWAARWSHFLGPMDFGVTHFQGTSREPLLSGSGGPGDFKLTPYYPVIDQTGVDVQATLGGWLLKFEGIRRAGFGQPGAEQTYTAVVGGFEYTLIGLGGTVYDLGLISEVHYDDRGDNATTPFEEDLFLGARLVLNDVQSTECLAGVIIDADSR